MCATREQTIVKNKLPFFKPLMNCKTFLLMFLGDQYYEVLDFETSVDLGGRNLKIANQ